MAGTFLGINLKYLPWEVSVPIMFGISMSGIYYAITIKGKRKVINIFFFCGAISILFSGIELLAKNTGIFAQYLPIVEPMYWFFACILVVLIFFFF